jgi:hypothetical protein
VPFYGSGHACVAPAVAGEWLERLLAMEVKRPDELVFPLAQVCGDRARDVEPALREKVAQRLAGLRASEALVRMLREQVELGEGDERRVFGERLPAGAAVGGGGGPHGW